MSKRAQLVCQHLENISRAALEEHQDIVRQYVRGRQGVYALFRKGKLYYVGLATNLRNRLSNHLKDRHGDSWDGFSVYLTIGDHHLRELESLMLRVMKPAGNKQKGKFAKSEDLRRRFQRDLKRSAMLEVQGFFIDPRRPRIISTPIHKVAGRTPIMAQYISGPIRLRGTIKGKKMTAQVRRDGTIRFAGEIYTSPSVAAAVAVKRISCNGWGFWHYERAPGDWVTIDALRR